MNILITGGQGFIGQKVNRILTQAGYNTTSFDIRIRYDIFVPEEIQEAVVCHDIIIHLVGQPDMRVAQDYPEKSFYLNILSLQNVLEACRLAGTPKRLILPSSAAIYGVTQHLPISEFHPVNPFGIYSWHKLMEEMLVKAYADNYNIEYVILRLFNVYGSRSKGLISMLVEKGRKGEPVRLYGKRQLRDWVHLDDVAEAFALAVEKGTNQILNIGSGVGTSISTIVDMIQEVYSFEVSFDPSKIVEYDAVADISLAKAVLGWNPSRDRESIKNMLRGGK